MCYLIRVNNEFSLQFYALLYMQALEGLIKLSQKTHFFTKTSKILIGIYRRSNFRVFLYGESARTNTHFKSVLTTHFFKNFISINNAIFSPFDRAQSCTDLPNPLLFWAIFTHFEDSISLNFPLKKAQWSKIHVFPSFFPKFFRDFPFFFLFFLFFDQKYDRLLYMVCDRR